MHKIRTGESFYWVLECITLEKNFLCVGSDKPTNISNSISHMNQNEK